jgi:F-type H+-transporting ATPase subunit b
MLIDWFTVAAQVVNFLILVGLMKRFLYQPILRAIDAREKRIADELADAAAQKVEAKSEREEFQHKNEEFDQQRDALLSKARDEAEKERGRLLDQVRTAADLLAAKRQESLRNDARNLNQAITRKARDEVFAITRRTLEELSGARLEDQIVGVFIKRLGMLDQAAKSQLGEALGSAHEPALIRSVFELDDEARTAVQKAINEAFSSDVPLRYETCPDLVSGIELTTNGRKLAWSIADYLKSLETGVSELLETPASA